MQSAVDAAFGKIAGAKVTVTQASGVLDLSFGGSLAGHSMERVSLAAVNSTSTGTTGTGSFVVGNTAANVANLKAAYATMLGTSADNIGVRYDAAYVGGERYVVSFIGTLDKQDIPDKTFSYNAGQFKYSLVQGGAAPVNEVQRVFIDRDSATSGSVQLALTQGASTYSTGTIAFGATAAELAAQLNTALGSAGSVTVSLDAQGAYLVQFGGGLAGKDVASLKVAQLGVASAAPSGNFTVSLAGAMSAPVAYSANSATLAANIQTALEGLAGIGAGNVTVTVDAGRSVGDRVAFQLAFASALAHVDVADITAHFGDLDLALVKPSNLTQGRAVAGEVQRVVIDTTAAEASFTLAWGGQSTAAIASDATADICILT